MILISISSKLIDTNQPLFAQTNKTTMPFTASSDIEIESGFLYDESHYESTLNQSVNTNLIGHESFEDEVTAYSRFVPSAILDDGISSTRLEVYGGTNVISVELLFDVPLIVDGKSGCDDVIIPLYDDGTHGDVWASDGIFSIGGIVWDQEGGTHSCPLKNYFLRTIPGVLAFKASAVFTYESGTQYNFYSIVLDVLDQLIFTELDDVIQLSSEAQVSSNVTNIVDNEYRLEGWLGRWGDNTDIRPLIRKLYHVIPDDFQFLHLTSTLYPDELIGRPYIGLHGLVKVDWTGTGLDIFDHSSDYGSEGTLLGINGIVSRRNYDTPALLIHETKHQWTAFLDPSLGLSDGIHWKGNTSVACVWTDNGDGTFTSDGSWSDTGRAPPLELYLMGLAHINDVSPLYWAENQEQDFCIKGTIITGPFHKVTIEDIIAVEGLRTPGPDSSRTEFRMAFVVTTQNRLLTPLEMTLYNKLAKYIEGSVEDQGDYLTFFEFTNGKANLKTYLGDQISPKLRINPVTINFNKGSIDPEIFSAPIRISNTGYGELNWVAGNPSTSWFSINPMSGIAPSEALVTVDSTGLPSGIYTGRVTIDGGSNTQDSPQTVFISLTIEDIKKIYLPVIRSD